MDGSNFPWLSCEDSDFVGYVYDLAMPVHLGEYSYDTLVTIAPDRAYVLDAQYRTARLVERFESLNTVVLMLNIETFPLQSSLGAISRESWIRVILDVLLVRLTSIRDCAFLLVAEIFELKLDPRKVTLKTIKASNKVPVDPIVQLLTDISGIGRDFRDERDLNFHRGEHRQLGTDSTTYKVASLIESWGQGVRGTDILGNPIELNKAHREIVSQTQSEFLSIGQELQIKVLELLNALYPFFRTRFRTKRTMSQLG